MTTRRPSAARTPASARATQGSERRPAAPPRRSRPVEAAASSRSRFTTRATILALVMCALALSLAYPVREFLAQRSDIAELRAQNRAQQAEVDALDGDLHQWQDPAYVETQARRRLQFSKPGETNLVVVEADPAKGTSTKVAAARAAVDDAWFSSLWGTVQAADRVHPAKRHP